MLTHLTFFMVGAKSVTLMRRNGHFKRWENTVVTLLSLVTWLSSSSIFAGVTFESLWTPWWNGCTRLSSKYCYLHNTVVCMKKCYQCMQTMHSHSGTASEIHFKLAFLHKNSKSISWSGGLCIKSRRSQIRSQPVSTSSQQEATAHLSLFIGGHGGPTSFKWLGVDTRRKWWPETILERSSQA